MLPLDRVGEGRMETVRAAFREGVAAYLSRAPRPSEPTVLLDGQEMPLGALARIAIGLHQDLPEALCAALGIPARSTYSQGAKRVQELLRGDAAPDPVAPIIRET